MAACGGFVLLGFTQTVFLNLGEPFLFPSIAAVVVGGTVLAGGKGSYTGTMAGALVLYPSSSLHRVAPVLAGERLASFFWVQSMIRDDAVRSALYDLDRTIQTLCAHEHSRSEDLVRLGAVYHNLLRVHAEC